MPCIGWRSNSESILVGSAAITCSTEPSILAWPLRMPDDEVHVGQLRQLPLRLERDRPLAEAG